MILYNLNHQQINQQTRTISNDIFNNKQFSEDTLNDSSGFNNRYNNNFMNYNYNNFNNDDIIKFNDISENKNNFDDYYE